MSELKRPSKLKLPKARWHRRYVNTLLALKATELGFDPIVAKIIASRVFCRPESLDKIIFPKLQYLDSPIKLKDMEKSANRIAFAIMQKEVIGLETDHDCDGQTAHAVLFYNLLHHFKLQKEKICSFIGHRLEEGYGLSEKLMHRILKHEKSPTLIITADNGSSDEPRIKILKAHNIDVIVTDHHQIPTEGVPESAYACINPIQEGCAYPDNKIAGCMVAWLLMAAVRKKLIEHGYLPKTAPNLSDTLDYVALGTIADCVSMAESVNNRAVVAYGLGLIAQETKPCWRALAPILKETVSSQDLGFKIGPLLNSDGRLCTALKSVSFLLAQDDEEAQKWVEVLSAQNEKRKTIQKALTKQAIEKALLEIQKGHYGLCLFLENGHTGVHGITASRIKDYFGRPTIIFSQHQTDNSILSGSARGIDNFHVREALQVIFDQQPGLLIAFGGHKAAGGVSIKADAFEVFATYFEKAVQAQLAPKQLGPILYTDGELPQKYFNLDFVSQLKALEPFGRGFEPPIFEMQAQLIDLRPVGDGRHARVCFQKGEMKIVGIWFEFREDEQDPIPVQVGYLQRVAFSLVNNVFQGKSRLEIQVKSIDRLK